MLNSALCFDLQSLFSVCFVSHVCWFKSCRLLHPFSRVTVILFVAECVPRLIYVHQLYLGETSWFLSCWNSSYIFLISLCVCIYAVDLHPASCKVSSSIPSALAALWHTSVCRGAAETRGGRGAEREEEKTLGKYCHRVRIWCTFLCSAGLWW